MLNWNPSGPATFVINDVYSGGTISTENAYKAGLANGRASVCPSRQELIDIKGKRSFSFNTENGICYVVDIMMAGYCNVRGLGVSGGEQITSFQNNLSRGRDLWTTNMLIVLRANSNRITIRINDGDTPGGGEYDFTSYACVFKCS